MAVIAVSGGHLTPALATIEELTKRGHEIIYVNGQGRPYQDATEIMRERGIKVYEINTSKWHRHSLHSALGSLIKMPLAVGRCGQILEKEKVNVILSFGGYQSIPLVLAGKLLGKKMVTHEQTLTPGLATRVNSIFVDKVAVANELGAENLPKSKIVITGNPVRKDILVKVKKLDIFKRPYIYISGGHLGSGFINQLVEQCFDNLIEQFDIVHSIGNHPQQDVYWEKAIKQKSNLSDGKLYWPQRYFGTNEVASIIQNAEFVISRSGANTCWELARLNKPCILIPLLTGQRGEQYKNAKLLEECGLAMLTNEKEITSEEFVKNIYEFESNINNFEITQENLDRYYPLGGDVKLADLVESLCGK